MLNLLMIAIGLSMDAFAVSMTNGMYAFGHYTKKEFVCKTLIWSSMFGLFQGIMPITGYLLGRTFASFINCVDHWIAFILLLIIGSKMIWEAVSPSENKMQELNFSFIITQAIATSIDALAVGVSFALLGSNILYSSMLIATTTLLFCLLGAYLGKAFGSFLKHKAEIFGGVILILIGLKIFLEHTLL